MFSIGNYLISCGKTAFDFASGLIETPKNRIIAGTVTVLSGAGALVASAEKTSIGQALGLSGLVAGTALLCSGIYQSCVKENQQELVRTSPTQQKNPTISPEESVATSPEESSDEEDDSWIDDLRLEEDEERNLPQSPATQSQPRDFYREAANHHQMMRNAAVLAVFLTAQLALNSGSHQSPQTQVQTQSSQSSPPWEEYIGDLGVFNNPPPEYNRASSAALTDSLQNQGSSPNQPSQTQPQPQPQPQSPQFLPSDNEEADWLGPLPTDEAFESPKRVPNQFADPSDSLLKKNPKIPNLEESYFKGPFSLYTPYAPDVQRSLKQQGLDQFKHRIQGTELPSLKRQRVERWFGRPL